MNITSLQDAAPFVTADGSLIRELLNADNSSLRNQSLAHATLSPGQSTARHFHPRAEEIYFVLSGQGRMEIGEESQTLQTGDAVAITAGTPHSISNVGEVELNFLCCRAPAYSHEDTVLCP